MNNATPRRVPGRLEGLEPSRMSRAEALARRIEEHIREEALPEGSRLGTKGDLRARFGVAVGTINEAVRVLETQGLIEARPGPGGGVFVAAPSPHLRLSHLILGFSDGAMTVAHCLAVRNALEPLVAEEAARFRTERDVADLQGILARMASSLDDPPQFLEANWALHRRLLEISPNGVLRAVYATLMDFIEAGVQDVTPDEVFRGRGNLHVHEALIDAIASGDQTKVARAVRRHSPHTEWIAASAGDDD